MGPEAPPPRMDKLVSGDRYEATAGGDELAREHLNLDAAVDWYRSYLNAKRGVARREAQRRMVWIEHFCECLPRRCLAVGQVSVRDVVVYFADHADYFEKPMEWYSRYKALESFWDDMVEARLLEANGIKGIYDDTDIEPYYQEDPTMRAQFTPVNWSRAEVF